MIIQGDALTELRKLPAESVHCCVTSPPYWGLRDYGVDGQMGLDPTVEEYVARMTEVFREVRRMLRQDGTCWINMGDSYAASSFGSGGGWAKEPEKYQDWNRKGPNQGRSLFADPGLKCGLKPKNLIGMPWRVAFALQADGWYLRQDIIWHKPNPMPESIRDRCTKSHEYLFLMTKSARYWYDSGAIKEPASPNSHARYGRGRSDHHKWADGGPGGQTIARTFEHMTTPGVNPKAKILSGWDTGKGAHGTINRTGRNLRPKQNESFSAAVKDVVEYRNKRSVWSVPTAGYAGAHFATYPPNLIRPCILAGCPPSGIVLDPFAGAGTTGQVAAEEGRDFILIELNPDYIALIRERLKTTQPGLRLEA